MKRCNAANVERGPRIHALGAFRSASSPVFAPALQHRVLSQTGLAQPAGTGVRRSSSPPAPLDPFSWTTGPFARRPPGAAARARTGSRAGGPQTRPAAGKRRNRIPARRSFRVNRVTPFSDDFFYFLSSLLRLDHWRFGQRPEGRQVVS